jgi:hypothetical protein
MMISGGKPENLGEKLASIFFVHHDSHMNSPEIEP